MDAEFPISDSQIQLYLESFGCSDLHLEMVNTKKRTQLAALFGYAGVVNSALPELALKSGFQEYVTLFRTTKASSAIKVWSTPGAYYWNSLTRQFIDVAIHSAAIPSGLQKYLDFCNIPFLEALEQHMNGFGRFLLAASVDARLPIDLKTAVQLNLPTCLPGTQLALLPNPTVTGNIQIQALGHAIIEQLHQLQDGSDLSKARVEFVGATPTRLEVMKLPAWYGRYGALVVDSFDPYLNLPYIEQYPRVQGLDDIAQFAGVHRKGIDYLAEFDLNLAAELSFLVSCVTPMDATGTDAEMCSGSSSDIFGACFLSVTDEPLFVAEMLLHEFSHNKLRLLQEFVDLLVPGYVREQKYYSPWRDDPRPLDGILHGLFVFGNLSRFWLSVLKYAQPGTTAEQLARRRVGTLLYQLRYAYEELNTKAPLTEQGQTFMAVVGQWIKMLEAETRNWDFNQLQPLFAGVIRNKKLKTQPIAEALPGHRADWEAAYPQFRS